MVKTKLVFCHITDFYAAEVKAPQVFDRFSDLIAPETEEKTEGSSLKKEA